MKKNVSGLGIAFLLLLLNMGSFAQPRKPFNISDARLLPAKNNSFTIRSNVNQRTQSCSTDSIVLTRQSQIDSFPITNPGCTILRELRIDGAGASPAITSLDSLKGIVQVTNNLTISNTAVTTLAALASLTEVNGLFWVNDNKQLLSTGLTGLTNIGLIIFYANDSLNNIAGLTNNLVNNGLGTLIMNNTALTNLNGLEGVHSVPNMYVSGNPYLTSLNGLHNLTNSDGGISLYYNPLLSDITALSGITNVDNGTLECSYNYALTSLNGLHNITHIGGGFWLAGNDNLTTLGSLHPNLVLSNSVEFYDGTDFYTDSIRIEWNYQLAACSFNPLCNFLDTSSAAIIHDNAAGCSSISEILANCGFCTNGVLKTWNGINSGDWDDPNNWSPSGVPQLCDSVVIPMNLTNYPYVNNDISIGALTMEPGSSLDMFFYNLLIKGRPNISDADIYSGGILTVSRPRDLSIEDSYLDFSDILINNYRGTLTFNNNTVTGNSSFSDDMARDGISNFNGNSFGNNFTITNNSTDFNAETKLSENSNDFVYGTSTFISNSSAPLRVGAGESFRFIGDVVVNSNIWGQPQLENIEFNGSLNPDIHLTQTGTQPIVIQKGTAFRFGPSFIIPDQHVYISSEFRFLSGVVKTNENGMFIFGDGANTTAWSGSSYIWGPVKKTGNNGFTFSVGDSIYRTVVHMTAPQISNDTIRIQYFHKDPTASGYNTALRASTLDSVSGREYWHIQEIEGPVNQRQTPLSNNLQFTFYYDSARSGAVQSLQHLRIARWNGSLWEDKGLGNATGNLAEANVTHSGILSEFGIFTFGFDSYKPVITIGQVDTMACGSTSFKVPVNVDSPMIAGNFYYVQLSDSAGSFANPVIIGSKQSITSDTVSAVVPSHIPNGNNYKIRIVATAPLDTSSNTVSIKVLQPPLFYSLTGPGTLCVGQTYKYYATQKQQGMSYTWTLTQGTATLVPDNDTVHLTATTPGLLELRLTTSNVCNFTYTYISGINVLPPPPTQTPTINNIGRWLYASALPPGATGYHWFRNDTLIAGANASSYYASLAGNYRVTFYVTCGDGPSSNIISFNANSIPQTITFPPITDKLFNDAPFNLNASTSSGLPIQYILLSGPGSISGDVYTINGTGVVTIKAIQPGDNVYDTATSVTQTFSVNKGSQIITFPVIPNQVIGAPPVSLTATSSSGLPVGYSIVSGPAYISGNLLYLAGVGSVTVRASQAGDGNYLAAVPVDRTLCINATLTTISGPQFICPGQMVTYSINNINNVSYSWRLSDGTTFPSTTNAVSFSIGSSGSYTLYVSATGPCGSPTVESSYTINVVNAVTPGAVSNMVPANGATGQELPLQLSWLPGNDALTYDIYVWDAELAQPSTPTAANRTVVSYTIPARALAYHKTYKWRVVSKNACLQTDGPVQTFTLKPLPDLMVSHVQTPSSANSGQTVSFSWRVTNKGPGHTTTNQRWTDAVFLSFDSFPTFSITPQTSAAAWNQLDFPIRPLLVGTKQNVSALDSGQHYTNTIDFTLPLNYSQPLYVYVITNYPASVNAPLQMTYANDSARAPQPVNVTLSPTPDLRVDSVLTPSSVFSGSTVNLTYKVKNYGVLTPAGSSWTDRFYISQSPLFNINTAIPLKANKANGSYYPNPPDAIVHVNSQMQADSFYTVNTQVVIPNFIFGSFFIYVRTNAGLSLYEGALANNNIGAAQLQVFLTPTPHLTVSSLTVPLATASVTQPVGINWNILNAGFNNNIEKNKGHYFVGTGSCTIPNSCVPDNMGGITCKQGIGFRDSLGFGGSYWIDRVFLSTDPTGLNANAIQIGDFNQGIANSGLFAPDNLQGNSCLNPGSQPGNLNTFNVIMPGTNHPANYNFNIPATLLPGNYYVYVLANAAKHVYEYPGTPQVRRSDAPISIQRPDLTPSLVTVPANSIGGQPVAIQYQITNNGPGGVFIAGRKDRVYVSASPVFDGNAELLTTLNFTESIAAGASVTHSYTKTFPPGTSGMRYFFVETNFDSSFRETNYTNNISTAASSSFATAVANDLVVSSFTVADSVFTIFNTPIKYQVVNNGTSSVNGTWMDSLFISCSATFNPATSFYIGRREHNKNIPAGGSYADSFNVNIPFAYSFDNSCFPVTTYSTAYFFIKTNANDGVYEGSNNTNNALGAGIRTIINPLVDHIVTNVTGATTALVARPYTVSWEVKNTGFDPAYPHYASWYDAIYFSADSIYDSGDRLAEHFYENQRLGTNQTYSRTKSFVVPKLTAGDYYVFAVSNYLNYIGAEKILSNNANLIRNTDGSARKIAITQPLLPDLVDSILTAPVSVAVGQPLQIIHQIKNIGVGDVYPPSWNNEVWLSADFIPGNGSDIKLTSKTYNSILTAGQTLTDTITANVNLNVIEGNYIMIMRTDPFNNVVESVDSNNLSFRFITVYRPAPADLVVEQISKPDTVLLGYTIDTARWVIANNSPNNAEGISTDGIYLSKSATLDSNATLIAVVPKQISIAALGRDTVSFRPLVNNVVEGPYNLLVKTDLLNNIVESNKENNTGITAGSIYVKVKELPLDYTETNTLHTINRYYKLVIPDSLRGSTILVTLKTADSLSVRNEMFIGLGYIPSPAQFDYRFETPNAGNQQIVMTSVVDSVYYITVRVVSPNPPVQNISLKAVKLPFAILNVQSSQGGNIGNVTVKISGSLFTNNMTASLTNGGTTINASAIYFTNSTQVYATFNLQGKPLGLYDVTLSKPDTSVATLNNGFSIVNANNGGLITGGGVNTGQSGSGNEPGCDPGAASGLNSQLVVDLVVPEKVFAGWPFVIQVNYTNPTNFDIPAQARIIYNNKGVPVGLTQSDLALDKTSLYLELTEPGGPPGIIRAGASGTITIYGKAPVTMPGHTFVKFNLK